ncbi:MAG TPA: hypothetical protein VMS43_07230 [Allosphingosinicella sp.]|nr:hypothetical protein [Allosphingosinicella sp.]
MADFLKQWYGLLTLKVTLFASPVAAAEAEPVSDARPHPHIEFTVERNVRGETVSRQSALLPLGATGIPDAIGNGPTVTFALADVLKDMLRNAVAESDPEEPLWLHLVKPYGHLGALPWEGLLTELTRHSVLRLPDFLEPPRENKSVLEAAIICDLDLEEHGSREAFRRAIEAWVGAPYREDVHVHVFASRLARKAAKHLATHSRVIFHHPDDMKMGKGAIPDPWQHWVTRAMAGRALDAVHLLCRATLSHGRSCISLSRPFQRSETAPVAFVYPDELASGLTQTGAWCLVVGGPADGSSDTALRHFVDAMAQTRPGPALFHCFDPDTIENEIRPAFRTLFGAERVYPPIFRRSFLYCQPELAMPGLKAVPKTEILALHRNTELLEAGLALAASAAPDALGHVPNWVAASQRFAEGVALETARRSSGDVLMSDPLALGSSGANSKGVEIVQDTVAEIQRIVSEYAREQLSDFGESDG